MNMCKFFEIFINIHKDIYLSNNVLSIETIFFNAWNCSWYISVGVGKTLHIFNN